MHLAKPELAIVRIENAIGTDLIFERQRLGFEFDTVFARNIRTHIHRRGCLLVGIFEDDLRIANRETVYIRDTPPKDESIVVEAKVGRV